MSGKTLGSECKGCGKSFLKTELKKGKILDHRLNLNDKGFCMGSGASGVPVKAEGVTRRLKSNPTAQT